MANDSGDNDDDDENDEVYDDADCAGGVGEKKNTYKSFCREMKMTNGQWPMANGRWPMANGQ